MRICEYCGKEITRKDRHKFCSPECYHQARIKQQNEKRKMTGRKEIQPLTTKKCKNCGKEFMQKTTHQEHCCYDCSLQYNAKRIGIRAMINRIAKKFDFEVKNADKIISAKIRFFKEGEYHRCPCASQDPDHYCGSARCIADTVYLGHCCCNLMHSKKKPLIEDKI